MFSKPSSTSESITMLWNVLLLVSLTAAVTLLPDIAAAQAVETPGKIQTVLCNLVKWLTGPTGKAIATLAIIIIGVGALMGKVSWGMAIIVALGVGIIFGAPTIVDKVSGTQEAACGV